MGFELTLIQTVLFNQFLISRANAILSTQILSFNTMLNGEFVSLSLRKGNDKIKAEINVMVWR